MQSRWDWDAAPTILLTPTKWLAALVGMTIFPKSGKWLPEACDGGISFMLQEFR
jgi:hypothetical protein